ncbi:MAG: cytochrome b/b6 domain-containing protein [Chloroflexi bacterium]|nr:cytochrome b/b6 domain-containing protein [Chloroflexota bacterium]
MNPSSRFVQRYAKTQCLIHWVGVITFFALLFSGIALIFAPLSWFAAGGVSKLIHRIAIVPFVVLPILYVILIPRQARALIAESFTYTRDDWAWFKCMPAYFFGSTKNLPPQGRINAGQKIHHALTFVMFVSVSVSGFGLLFGKGRLGVEGLAFAAIAHDLSMLGLTVLLIGHLYFTLVYDALSAMVRGVVSEEYARMEHPKWVAELPENAFIVARAREK